jgi:hypothetical protein
MKHHHTDRKMGASKKGGKMSKTKTHKKRSMKYRGGWVTNTTDFLNNGYMEEHQSTLPADINKDYHMINTSSQQSSSSSTNVYLVAGLATAGAAVGAYVLLK